MVDGSDNINVCHTAAGEIMVRQYRGWWKYYPKPSKSKLVSEPFPHMRPAFQIGDFVRLKGKPEKVRKVLYIDWHGYRYEFVYIVETSAPAIFSFGLTSPYWFAPQLILEQRAV
jgi:hypothetical protein